MNNLLVVEVVALGYISFEDFQRTFASSLVVGPVLVEEALLELVVADRTG